MKKCPPGVICVENITLTVVIIIFALLVFFIYINSKDNTKKISNNITIDQPSSNLGWLPSWPYTNVPDVLLNPYSPPFKDERYFVPINISTNIGAVRSEYRQLGIITPLNGASITTFSAPSSNSYLLTYKIGAKTGSVQYSWTNTNLYTFVFTDVDGKQTNATYQRK
jgi:hypothetical protein